MRPRIALLLGVMSMGVVTTRAQTTQSRPRDPEWNAPAQASAKTNPLAGRPETAAGGRKLFEQRCSTCHARDGHGSDRAPDITTADVQMQTDGAIFWKISGGNTRAGMPAFSSLPELQRWQLVMHVRWLGWEAATPDR